MRGVLSGTSPPITVGAQAASTACLTGGPEEKRRFGLVVRRQTEILLEEAAPLRFRTTEATSCGTRRSATAQTRLSGSSPGPGTQCHPARPDVQHHRRARHPRFGPQLRHPRLHRPGVDDLRAVQRDAPYAVVHRPLPVMARYLGDLADTPQAADARPPGDR